MPSEIKTADFGGGEISPELYGRSDLQIYPRSMAEIRNFLVSPIGTMISRPGTRYIGRLQDGNERIRMFAFDFGRDAPNTYVIVFGHEYIKFIQTGEILRSATGGHYRLASEYQANELRVLRLEQTYDLIRITHVNHPIRNLVRRGHTNWELNTEQLGSRMLLNARTTMRVASRADDPESIGEDAPAPMSDPPSTLDEIEDRLVEGGTDDGDGDGDDGDDEGDDPGVGGPGDDGSGDW